MSRFLSAEHLASWAGMCPATTNPGASTRAESHARAPSGSAPRSGSAHAAVRKKDSYLAERYARLNGRRGHPKAILAVDLSILVVAYHLLSRGEPYSNLGAAHYLEATGPRAKSGA
jgi:transposase